MSRFVKKTFSRFFFQKREEAQHINQPISIEYSRLETSKFSFQRRDFAIQEKRFNSCTDGRIALPISGYHANVYHSRHF